VYISFFVTITTILLVHYLSFAKLQSYFIMLTTYLKYKPAWQQFFSFLGIVLLFLLLQSILVTPIICKLNGVSSDHLNKIIKGELQHPATKNILASLQVVQFFALFLLPSLLFAYFADSNPQAFLGISHFSKSHYFLQALALIVVGAFAVGFLGYINKLIPLPKSMLIMEDKQDAAVATLAVAKNIPELILSMLIIGVFASVGEELFFRGVLQRILIQWTKNPWVGILVTACFFSAIHLQFVGFLPRVGLGILLGALYWYSGSLWPGILFHFVYNSLGVIMAYNNPKTLQQESLIGTSMVQTIILGVLSMIAVVYMVTLMKRKSTTRFEKVYPPEPDFFN
jgi:uncharacterized protein